jgi:hypothetical protein
LIFLLFAGSMKKRKGNEVSLIVPSAVKSLLPCSGLAAGAFLCRRRKEKKKIFSFAY